MNYAFCLAMGGVPALVANMLLSRGGHREKLADFLVNVAVGSHWCAVCGASRDSR